jgi:hypothetical protein
VAAKTKKDNNDNAGERKPDYEVVNVFYSATGAKWTVYQPILPPDEAERQNKRAIQLLPDCFMTM